MRFILKTVATFALLAGSAQAQGIGRFVRAPAAQPIEAASPGDAGAAASDQIIVVLKLSGDPVAVVQARAPGKQISPADRARIESDLAAQQRNLTPMIEANRGTVLATFQNAINGIKVQIPAGHLAAFATLPGVVGVKGVRTHTLNNANSVPFIGGDAVWGATGFHGENIKIAIIDTGIDYTHANFGGPGTAAAFKAAAATSTLAADPTLFGPNAFRVKGGTDLVGDDYNANVPGSTPVPDTNPLDCNSHGTHTAGTAAGSGVLADGSTFHGPYDASTPGQKFIVGPGVAPRADLYAVRVFGCSGSTNVVTEAIDWSIKNGMQVISMSLGANFGDEDSADAEASENAAEAGVIVVAASGNAGSAPYITSSPAAGDKTISVAAMDTTSPASFGRVQLALTGGGNVLAQNSNNAPITDGTSLQVVVLRTASGAVSLGCSEAEYVDATIAGKLVVTRRGVCARVDRATFGQRHGAAAVALINSAASLPPFEGTIQGVSIPFLGLSKADGPMLVAAAGAILSNAAAIPNADYHAFASFSSAGPRSNDGVLKPDITAPGVNIVSSLMGTGTQGAAFSGTSMATPHVAGVAVLALQAHPGWDPADVRTAILNTADASVVHGFRVSRGGSGAVEALPAVQTSVVARDARRDAANLSFGVVEFGKDLTVERELLVTNLGEHDARFNVSAVPVGGSPHTVELGHQSITVDGGESRRIRVRLHVPAATAGDSSGFREVAGLIVLTPSTAGGEKGDDDANGATTTLSVPYLLIPRARSAVAAKIDGDFGPATPSAALSLHNESAQIPGTADVYAWGLSGTNASAGRYGVRAVGVQSFDDPSVGKVLVFAVNTFKPWSNAAPGEFDVLIDTNGDGIPDFAVVAADFGSVIGAAAGQTFVAVINLATGTLVSINFFATAPTDGSTMLLPVIASDLGITAANPRLGYTINSFDGFTAGFDQITTPAMFNAFNNSITTGDFAVLAAGGSATVSETINPAEWAKTPALGLMVVSLENFSNGHKEQQSILLKVPHD